jgi:hypothetical protein
MAAVAALAGLWPGAAPAACPPGAPLRIVSLGAGLWLLPAAAGEADASNRGFVSNLLLARHQGRLWLLGSGPSPAFGRALACQVSLRFGLPVSEVINPWAHAELVLGNAGFPQAVIHAHRRVAEAMAEQCAHCVARLRQRLGDAADDIGADPARLPALLLEGDHGSLGPFDWWRLPRSAERDTTVWRHRAAAVTVAHGLLWFDGPPDGSDAELRMLALSTQRVLAVAGKADRWVGERGPPAKDAEARGQSAYWQALLGAAERAVERGELIGPPPALPGVSAALTAHPRHALNWQRAWRQAEDRALGALPETRPEAAPR